MTAKEKQHALVDGLGMEPDEAAHMLVDMGEIDSSQHADLLSPDERFRIYGGSFKCKDPEGEYIRGMQEAAAAQEAGPPGSPEREAAYREMEDRWASEGFEG